MLFLIEFTIAAITAIAMENIVLTRALDNTGFYRFFKSPRYILLIGIIVTMVTAISSVPVYFINQAIRPLPNFIYIAAISYILVNAVVYVITYLFIKVILPPVFQRVEKALPFCGVNCATLGSLLVSSQMSDYHLFAKFLGYNIGTGIGLTFALLLLWGLNRKMQGNNVPKAFRGLPITLIYIGLLSLSIFGLVGNQLPA